MRLYHFTTAWMLGDIMKQGLTLGTLPTWEDQSGKPVLIPGHQWLTTNPAWIQEWERHSTLPYRRNDYRLHLEIPEVPRLRPWSSFEKQYPGKLTGF